MTPFLTSVALMLGSWVGDDMSRQQLSELIDAAQGVRSGDVRFDYEGKRASLRDNAPEEVRRVYTGSFSRRSDGATLIDVYQFDHASKEAYRAIIATTGDIVTSSGRPADQKNANIRTAKIKTRNYAGYGSYQQIWLSDLVKLFANSFYLYEYEGLKRLDDAECVVVRFRLLLADDLKTPKERLPSEVFWVDLNRGGHVIRREHCFPGDKIAEATTIELRSFEPRPGRLVWLPSSGKVESFLTASKDMEPVFLDKPIVRTNYMMLPNTLRVDQGLKDSYFSVNPRRGDVVSDQIKKAEYEYGQYMIRPKTVTREPTDAEVKAELDRMLNDSKVMANELKATSPTQEQSIWWMLWPWAIAGVALAGGGFLYYRRRQE